MKRMAVVGLGRMGMLHASILSRIPDAELVAIVDQKRSLGSFVRGAGIRAPFYTSIEQMITHEAPDAAFLCVPSALNYPLARECSQNGVSVFLEKPLSESLDSATKLVALAQATGIHDGLGYMVAHLPSFTRAGELLSSGAVGVPRHIEASANLGAVFARQKSWVTKPAVSGGGAVASIGCHLLYLLNEYFGQPDEVTAALRHLYNQVEDEASIQLNYGNGLQANLEASWSASAFPSLALRIVVEGTEGNLLVTNRTLQLSRDEQSGATGRRGEEEVGSVVASHEPFYLGGEGYYTEDLDFVESLVAGRRPRVNWTQGLAVQEVLDAIYRSARTGAPAAVDKGD